MEEMNLYIDEVLRFYYKKLAKLQKETRQIEKATGIETRHTVIGHVQRGGSPTVRDRVAASLMAVKATEVLQLGEKNKIIASKNDTYVAIDIEEALEMKKEIDESMIETSKMLSL